MRQGNGSMRGLATGLATAIVIAACQPSQPASETPTLSPSAAAVTPSAEADTTKLTLPPFFPSPTFTPTFPPEPTFMPTSTPQPFITDGGALPAGARMRIGIGQIMAAAPSPDGMMLAVGTGTGIYVYRTESLERVWRRYTEYPVDSVAWSPDGKRLVTGSGNDGDPILWDAATGQKLNTLKSWFNGIWSPDGTLIAVSMLPRYRSKNDITPGGVAIFNGLTGALVRELRGNLGSDWECAYASSIAWSPDGQTLATRICGDIYLWDIRSFEVKSVFVNTGEVHMTCPCIAFSPNGKYLSVIGHVGSVAILNAENGKKEAGVPHSQIGGIRMAAWSPDSKRLASISETKMIITDTSTWEAVATTIFPQSDNAVTLAWSPDSRNLAAVMSRGTTHLISADGEELSILPGGGYFEGWQQGLAWFSDGLRLLTYNNQNLTIWDTQTVTVQQGFSTIPDISDIAWSPDGGTLILSTPDGYQFWDASKGIMLPSASAGLDPATLSFAGTTTSPDGTLIASATGEPICGDGSFTGGCFNRNGHVTIQEAETGRIIFEADYPDTGIGSLAWSPDGTLIAIGFARYIGIEAYAFHTTGNEVVVIDVATGQTLFTFSGHSGNVLRLAWSPNGYWLASASGDATVIVWNVPR